MAQADLPFVAPDWRRKPSGDDVAYYYPARAIEEGVSGKAVIQCRTTLDCAVTDCVVLSEEPAGYGFGMAALEMSELFEMEPAVHQGVQQTGLVRIPIAFRLPDGASGELTPTEVHMDWPQVSPYAPAVALGVSAGAALLLVALYLLIGRKRT